MRTSREQTIDITLVITKSSINLTSLAMISLIVSHCRLVLLLHRHFLLFLVYFVVLLCQINRIVFYLKF